MLNANAAPRLAAVADFDAFATSLLPCLYFWCIVVPPTPLRFGCGDDGIVGCEDGGEADVDVDVDVDVAVTGGFILTFWRCFRDAVADRGRGGGVRAAGPPSASARNLQPFIITQVRPYLNSDVIKNIKNIKTEQHSS